MDMVLGRSDRLGLELFCVDAEDAGLLMVDPHDRLMSVHGKVLKQTARQALQPANPPQKWRRHMSKRIGRQNLRQPRRLRARRKYRLSAAGGKRKTTCMTARESVAVLVAHPDDETLWAGGTLLSETSWSTFVWCACRAHDRDRAPKFHRVLERLGAQGAMADLDDSPEQPLLADEQVERSLLECLPSRHFDRILTHSPIGEYTRHQRHEDIARAVLRLWLRGTLSAAELWLFAYEDDGGNQLPRAMANADLVLELSPELWARKQRLITEDYGFAEASWEARTTPRREGFFRVTTFEGATAWLAKRRSQ